MPILFNLENRTHRPGEAPKVSGTFHTSTSDRGSVSTTTLGPHHFKLSLIFVPTRTRVQGRMPGGGRGGDVSPTPVPDPWLTVYSYGGRHPCDDAQVLRSSLPVD